MGVVVCDIGGGTTDLAIYVDGDVWHTMVLAVGGNHITQDIAHGLRLPIAQAEEIKKQQGHAVRSRGGRGRILQPSAPLARMQPVQINRQDLAHIIEARVEEIFGLILQEIKRSGYDGLLPAGMVLTGGTSALPGIRRLASQVLGMPVRTARPENLVGLVDQLELPGVFNQRRPAALGAAMHERRSAAWPNRRPARLPRKRDPMNLDNVKDWLKRLLP